MRFNKYHKVLYIASTSLAVTIATFLVSSIVAPAERVDADTVAYKDATTGYVTSVQSADNLTLEMTTLPRANLAKISDTVVTKTTNPNGYQLYFSMDRVSDYANNRPGNALYMDNNPTSSNFIPSTTNTFAAPGDLADNTWGFSLDDGASFSAVPLRNSAVKVAESDSATSATGDSLAVTYGVSANNALPDGTYSGRIVYNVVSETSATDVDRMMLSPSEVEPGDTLSIRTSLYTTHTFATTDISVKIATSESGTASTGNACEVTSVSTADGMLSLECTVPEFDLDIGTYNLPIEVSVPSYGKTYSGTIAVNVTVIPVRCAANTICYAPNGADVEGKMGTNGEVTASDTDQIGKQTQIYLDYDDTSTSINTGTISSSTPEITLFSSNYSRSGYGFAGWNTKPDGSGTSFGPNETLVAANSSQASDAGVTLTSDMLTQLGTSGITMYAQWIPAEPNTDLQTWTGCSTMNQGDVIALTDSRDNQTYAVAKLKDDKCWMIENLRYKPSVGTETQSFTTSLYNIQQYSLTNINIVNGTTPATSLDAKAVSQQGSPYFQWYSYGGQYSWASAIASATTNSNIGYNSNTNQSTVGSSSFSTTGATMADRSSATTAVKNANICPAGWRLPRSAYDGSTTNTTANNDFPYLQNALNGSYDNLSSNFPASNNWRKFPNNFVFAGFWNGTNAYTRGTYGNYWSSTVYNSNFAYTLYLFSTRANPANNNYKYLGFSVRCVYSN